MYVYGTRLFYACCSDCVGVCGDVCCVAAIVEECFLKPRRVEVCWMFVTCAAIF